MAQQLIGEISALETPRPLGHKPRVPAGALSTFAYDIRADISETDVGFDAMEIFTPSRPQFREMFTGDPPVATVPEQRRRGRAGPEACFFPSQRLTHQSPSALRVVFDAEVFVQSTFFRARVFDTQSDESPQQVLPGDANPTVLTNDLRVLTTACFGAQPAPAFAVQPAVLTPNGDGVNERVRISCTLVQLQQPVQLAVRIFSVGGQRVRSLFTGARGSGSFAWEWDGRDDSGNPVPVGLYLAKVTAEAERERFTRLGAVGVAY